MGTEQTRWPPWVVTTLAFVLSLVVALLDNLTGAELSFSLFYIGPVALAAWYGPPRTGVILAVWSGILWLAVDLTGGAEYSLYLIPYWNALVRLGFFLTISLLLILLRRTLEGAYALAFSDPLTGLPNARRFRELLEAEIARTRRYSRSMTLAYLDLDNFKAVNDSRGHAEGDRVLRTVAHVMRGSVRSTDWVARLGGDEFGILLPETREDGALEGLRKLRTAVLDLATGEGWPISVSMGSVTFYQAPDSLEEAILKADRLMYQVKLRGKDGILQEVVGELKAPESSVLPPP